MSRLRLQEADCPAVLWTWTQPPPPPQFFKDWWDFLAGREKCESIPGGSRAVSKDGRWEVLGFWGRGWCCLKSPRAGGYGR